MKVSQSGEFLLLLLLYLIAVETEEEEGGSGQACFLPPPPSPCRLFRHLSWEGGGALKIVRRRSLGFRRRKTPGKSGNIRGLEFFFDSLKVQDPLFTDQRTCGNLKFLSQNINLRSAHVCGKGCVGGRREKGRKHDTLGFCPGDCAPTTVSLQHVLRRQGGSTSTRRGQQQDHSSLLHSQINIFLFVLFVLL